MISSNPRLSKPLRVATTALTALFAAAALLACGPSFPAWLLGQDRDVLEAPVVWLQEELAKLFPPAASPVRAVVDELTSPYEQTIKTDLADLEAALPGGRREVLHSYRQTREALTRYAEERQAWADWDEAYSYDPRPAEPVWPDPPLPAGLPAEFAEYLSGAIAYHRGDAAAARQAWTKLLDLPAAERRNRSTWAAFMLGRLAQKGGDAAGAVRWFGKTRQLAAEGFGDSLGLAAASLGWEAMAEKERGNPAQSLELYARQAQSGDPQALLSLRQVSRGLLKDPEALVQVAQDVEARRVMTSYVLSRWERVDEDETLETEPAQAWLAAVVKAKVPAVDGADRLAWLAYRAGDFGRAEEWAQLAQEEPRARWIRAKLLLREGKLQESEALLAGVVAALPDEPVADDLLWSAYEENAEPAARPRAAGELGAVQLARGEYEPALSHLLQGGYWHDAAYVAERVLTLDELRRIVDASWSAEKAASFVQEGEDWSFLFAGLRTPPADRTAHDLRWLLGRRLVRSGRLADSGPYFPAEQRSHLAALTQALKEGEDTSQSPAARSGALFQAACITRHQGMDLLGTELEPDWFVYEGAYEVQPFAAERNRPAARLKASPDELARLAKLPAEPMQRFHYRYRAADLAWKAAGLLPDGDAEKARILAVGGTWLKVLSPQEADRFYKALVSCCGDTDLGREAAARRWFPEVTGCAPEAGD